MRLIKASQLFYSQLPLIALAPLAKIHIQGVLRSPSFGDLTFNRGLALLLSELARGYPDPVAQLFREIEGYRYVLVHDYSQPPAMSFLPLAGMSEQELQALKPEDFTGVEQQHFLRINRFLSSPGIVSSQLSQQSSHTAQNQNSQGDSSQAVESTVSEPGPASPGPPNKSSGSPGPGNGKQWSMPLQAEVAPKHWLALKYQTPAGLPLAGEAYRVTLGDGSEIRGVLDDKGEARLENIQAGKARVELGEAPAELDTLRSEIRRTLNAIIDEREAEAERIDKALNDMGELAATGELVAVGLKSVWSGLTDTLSFLGNALVKTAESAYYLSPAKRLTNLMQAGWQSYQDGELSESDWYAYLADNYQQQDYQDLVALLGFDPKDVDPQVFSQAYEITTLLLADDKTRELFAEFGQAYFASTSSTGWAEVAGGAVFEIVLAALLLVFTAGLGVAAQLAAKVKHADKLKALGTQLQQLGKRLKQKGRTKTLDTQTNKQVIATQALPDGVKIEAKPDLKSTLGKSVSMDGHKIYDPAFSPLSSNPFETYRYSDPAYRETGGDVYLGENIATSYLEVRKELQGKSVFMGEVQIDNILDLTDEKVLDNLDVDREIITKLVSSKKEAEEIYKYTNNIANQAHADGFNGILYPSSRKSDGNALILFNGRYDESNVKKIIDYSLNKNKG